MSNTNSTLCSSFIAIARPKAKYASIRRALSNLCYLIPTTTGTEIEYIVEITDKSKPNPILSLKRNSITFRFFFDNPSSIVYNQNFLIFVSLLAYLADFYEISLDSIYGYIIEFASRTGYITGIDNKERLTLMEKRLSAISAINSTLSHELVRLSKERSKALEDLKPLKIFCGEMMRSSKNMDINNTGKISLFSSTFGISDEVIIRAIKVLNNQG